MCDEQYWHTPRGDFFPGVFYVLRVCAPPPVAVWPYRLCFCAGMFFVWTSRERKTHSSSGLRRLRVPSVDGDPGTPGAGSWLSSVVFGRVWPRDKNAERKESNISRASHANTRHFVRAGDLCGGVSCRPPAKRATGKIRSSLSRCMCARLVVTLSHVVHLSSTCTGCVS